MVFEVKVAMVEESVFGSKAREKGGTIHEVGKGL